MKGNKSNNNINDNCSESRRVAVKPVLADTKESWTPKQVAT